MYTIKHAAELTGVPVATLRAWERRYGVVEPQRTEGGYRLYDDAALTRIVAVRDLVAQGWLPKLAAERVLADAQAGRLPSAVPAADVAPLPPVPPVPGPRTAAVGPDDAEHDPYAELVAAARDLAAARLAAVLDERFSRGSFEAVVDDWLMPALTAVGDAWAHGVLSTAAEHLVAHAVLRRLSAAFEAAAHTAAGPAVLVGLAPGSRHELGALAFATAARRAGLAVTYLGADLPVESWLDAVQHGRPRAVVVPVPRRQDVAGARAVLDAVRSAHPEVLTVAGGGQQDAFPAPVEHFGHRIGAAAAGLAARLG